MADLKKHALLLSLMAMLLVAKFIVVPIFAWQQQVVSDIASKQKKLTKVDNLLAEEQGFTQVNQELSEQLSVAEQLFYPYQSSAAFKLAQQQYFEGLVTKHQVDLSTFSWQNMSEDKALQITRYQVQIKLKGNVSNIVTLITELESQAQRIEVHNFNISLKGQNQQSLGKTRNARVNLRFYVHNQSSQASQTNQVNQVNQANKTNKTNQASQAELAKAVKVEQRRPEQISSQVSSQVSNQEMSQVSSQLSSQVSRSQS
jgi:hypothetical protein